ncbi:MAG: TetR/AcrR family transcriptional regulator [Nocardioidaceae bacterium]
MGRRKVEVRREEILAATLEEMQRLGMDQTRAQDVAQALGVSTGLLFYHFDSKDNLLAAALEYAVERDLARLDRALARGRTPMERLRRVVAAYGPTGSAPGWTLWIDAWSSALRHPPIRKMLRTLDDRWQAALTTAIQNGVDSGDFDCADPAATATRIGAQLDGLSVAVVVYRSISRAQLRRWIRVTVADELGIDAEQLA